MPLAFAPFVALLLGLGLGFSSARERGDVGARPPEAARATFAAAMLGVLVLAPILGYFAHFHRDWTYLYFIDERRIPSALDLAIVLICAAIVPIAAIAGARLAREQRARLFAYVTGGAAFGLLVLAAATARRLVTSASFAQFHGHFGTEPLVASALGRGVAWSMLVLAGGIVWGLRAAR